MILDIKMMLPQSFFQSNDVVRIARELIGCSLHSLTDGHYCSGIIIETEAYAGITDKASHAYGGRYTERTKVLYLPAAHMYVYMCYGMHMLFNIVTADENTPHAVLIRALLPLQGIEVMRERRGAKVKDSALCDGPGKLSQALAIGKQHNAKLLSKDSVWIERHSVFPEEAVLAGARIGVDYAEEDALLPYRFSVDKNLSSLQRKQ